MAPLTVRPMRSIPYLTSLARRSGKNNPAAHAARPAYQRNDYVGVEHLGQVVCNTARRLLQMLDETWLLAVADEHGLPTQVKPYRPTVQGPPTSLRRPLNSKHPGTQAIKKE